MVLQKHLKSKIDCFFVKNIELWVRRGFSPFEMTSLSNKGKEIRVSSPSFHYLRAVSTTVWTVNGQPSLSGGHFKITPRNDPRQNFQYSLHISGPRRYRNIHSAIFHAGTRAWHHTSCRQALILLSYPRAVNQMFDEIIVSHWHWYFHWHWYPSRYQRIHSILRLLLVKITSQLWIIHL